MTTPSRALFCGAVLALALTAGCGGEAEPSTPEATRRTEPGGLWHPIPTAEAQPEELEALADLPYLGGHAEGQDPGGVARHDLERAQDGINLVLTAHAPEAALMDMKGNVLHTWRAALGKAWPDDLGFAVDPVQRSYWRLVHAFANGDLLVLFEAIGLVRLDRNSSVIWAHAGRNHDGFAVAADGTIYALAIGPDGRDTIELLGADGNERKRVALGECLAAGDTALGANAIAVLDAGAAAGHDGWRAGQVLVSLSAIATLAVIDLEQSKAVWTAKGSWRQPQAVAVLADGHLLVFDGDAGERSSRVIELDPATDDERELYRGGPATPLFSPDHGGCQRLANGNTLIVESTGGRVFELAPDKRIVWEYVTTQQRDGMIADLTQVERLQPEPFADAFPAIAARLNAAGADIDTGALRNLMEKKK